MEQHGTGRVMGHNEEDEDMDGEVIDIERSGAKRGRSEPQDPRQAVLQFATQKATQALPQASQQTVNLILRGEFKTAGAIMNSRSEQQTRQCIEAAYGRNGIALPTTVGSNQASPYHGQHDQPASQPVCGIFFNDKDSVQFMETMTQQTELVSQLFMAQSDTITKTALQDIVKPLVQAMHDQLQAVNQMQQDLLDLKHQLGIQQSLPEEMKIVDPPVPHLQQHLPLQFSVTLRRLM